MRDFATTSASLLRHKWKWPLVVIAAILLVALLNASTKRPSNETNNTPSTNEGSPTPQSDVSTDKVSNPVKPTESLPNEAQKPKKMKWLMGVLTSSTYIAHRHAIRSTWMTWFSECKDVDITVQFFTGRVPANLQPLIDEENRVYGDIVSLDLEETRDIARKEKAMRWFQRIHANGLYKDFDFISKLDDDSYVYPQMVYEKYLKANWNNTMFIIGKDLRKWWKVWGDNLPYYYPGGQFYTFPPIMLEAIVRVWPNDVGEWEDKLLGKMFYEAKVDWTLIPMPEDDVFDIDNPSTDQTAWAHQLVVLASNPHHVRNPEDMLNVHHWYLQERKKQGIA